MDGDLRPATQPSLVPKGSLVRPRAIHGTLETLGALGRDEDANNLLEDCRNAQPADEVGSAFDALAR
jgi:hypothetical protein